MIANEAPEKIYYTPTEGGFYITTIKPEPPFAEGVEYIQTDAFIKKACEYWYKYNHDVVVNKQSHEFTVNVEDFKKYLKGE